MIFISSSVFTIIARSSASAKIINFLFLDTTFPLYSLIINSSIFELYRAKSAALNGHLARNLFSTTNYRSFFGLPLVRFPSIYRYYYLYYLFTSLFLNIFIIYFLFITTYACHFHVCKGRKYLPTFLCYFPLYYINQHKQIMNTVSSFSKTYLVIRYHSLHFHFLFFLFFLLASRNIILATIN